MENELEEKLDALLQNKTFDELENSDKAWVMEYLGSEAAYRRLATLARKASSEKERPVSPSIKQSLLATMKDASPKASFNLFTYSVPAYAAVLLAIALVGLTLLLKPTQKVVVQKQVLVATPPQVDTIRIVSPPDTIVIERLVQVPVYIRKTILETKVSTKTKSRLASKSLSDQKDVRVILGSSR